MIILLFTGFVICHCLNTYALHSPANTLDFQHWHLIFSHFVMATFTYLSSYNQNTQNTEFTVLHVCVLVCAFSTWLVCSQYLKRGSLTLGITSLYTMCSAMVVSRDKATPTQSITNRPEKCFIPICSVWRDKELAHERGWRQGKESEEVEGRQKEM